MSDHFQFLHRDTAQPVLHISGHSRGPPVMNKRVQISSPAYPLRERRKSRTRSALISAAGELFLELGYDGTTLEAIAQRAELHVQTLYRHFPNKESLALAADWDLLARFKDALHKRDPDQPFLEFWRAWVVRRAEQALERFPATFLQRVQDRERLPDLAGQALAVWNEYLELLTKCLAQDMGVNVRTNRYPRLFAAMLWGGNHSAVRRWAESGGKQKLVKEVGGVVDDVARLLELWQRAQR
jgi:AcrR family transcriptional regulator